MTRHTDQLTNALDAATRALPQLTNTIRHLATTATPGIPATDYDRTGSRPTTTPDPTGQTACADRTKDPQQRQADELRLAIVEATRACDTIARIVADCDPNRTVTILCPTCAMPIIDGQAECRRCATPEPRTCSNCGDQMAVGKPLRNGRCNACDITWRTQGRERITTTRLELEDKT